MNNVNFARSVLIVLVVLGHSLIFWTGEWVFGNVAIQEPILGHISNWFGTFHTHALTAISGFTYEYVIDKRGRYYFSDLFKKKIRRLLFPYLFISIFWVIPLTSIFIPVDSDFIVNKFVLGKSPAQLWFLLMLFNVFVLFFPLRHLLEKSSIFYVLFPFLYFISIAFGDLSNNYFQFFTSIKYLSFFAIGHLIYKHRKLLFTNDRCNLRQPLVLCTLALIHVIAYLLYLFNLPGTKTLLMLYLNIGGCFTATAILLYLGEKVNPNNKLMNAFSSNSFGVYLLHQQIIYFTLFYLNGIICPALHAIINFVVSLVLSLVLSALLHKIKFIRIYFLGEKK